MLEKEAVSLDNTPTFSAYATACAGGKFKFFIAPIPLPRRDMLKTRNSRTWGETAVEVAGIFRSFDRVVG